MPLEVPTYLNKTLRYKICDFFYNKRIKHLGIGGSFVFRLQEMTSILEYATGGDRTKGLGEELHSLQKERFGDLDDKPVINISNLPPIENFNNAFEMNQPLLVTCSSKNLEDYVKVLKDRTQAAMRHLGLVELVPLPSGGVKIVLGDKEMKINKSKRDNLNLCIAIVKLMYGESVKVYDDNISLVNYERKDFVEYFHLTGSIGEILGEEIDEDTMRKSIYDAIRHLNKRSMKIFESPLFEIKNEGLNWVL